MAVASQRCILVFGAEWEKSCLLFQHAENRIGREQVVSSALKLDKPLVFIASGLSVWGKVCYLERA